MQSTAPQTHRPAIDARAAIIVSAVVLLGLASLGVHQYLDATHRTTYVPAAKPVASAGLAPGWSQYREPSSGFAVQLPPGWSSIGYDVLANQAMLEKNYPKFAAIVRQYGDLSKAATQVKLIATNDAQSATFLVFERTGTPISIDDYIPVMLGAYDKMGAQQLEHHRVTLAAGEAERLEFRLAITGTGEPLDLHYLQYHILKTKGEQTTLFILQFTVTKGTTASGDAILEQVVSSFRII